jgi:hypothetical protein
MSPLRMLAATAAVLLAAGCGGMQVLGGAGGAPAPPDGADALRTETTTQVHEGVGRLVVDIDAGDVSVRAGEGGFAAVTSAVRWSGTRPEVAQVVDGDTLTVTARCPDRTGAERCEVDLTVDVPPTASSDVQVGAGDITGTAVTGGHVWNSVSGDVSAVELGAAAVRARSGAGDVLLAFAAVPLEVDAETAAGEVLVTVPGDARYSVDARSGAGETVVEVPTGPAGAVITAFSSAGDVTVRGAGS